MVLSSMIMCVHARPHDAVTSKPKGELCAASTKAKPNLTCAGCRLQVAATTQPILFGHYGEVMTWVQLDRTRKKTPPS
jgi:hypothetical protein